MQLFIVSVLDSGAGVFGRPVFVRSKAEAVRSFMDQVARPSTEEAPNQLHDHPKDFQLYLLGVFDDNNGTFEGIVPPEKMMDANACFKI